MSGFRVGLSMPGSTCRAPWFPPKRLIPVRPAMVSAMAMELIVRTHLPFFPPYPTMQIGAAVVPYPLRAEPRWRKKICEGGTGGRELPGDLPDGRKEHAKMVCLLFRSPPSLQKKEIPRRPQTGSGNFSVISRSLLISCIEVDFIYFMVHSWSRVASQGPGVHSNNWAALVSMIFLREVGFNELTTIMHVFLAIIFIDNLKRADCCYPQNMLCTIYLFSVD